MNDNEKHDKIPEVWEGHNIADYIDPGIMKVGLLVYIGTSGSSAPGQDVPSQLKQRYESQLFFLWQF